MYLVQASRSPGTLNSNVVGWFWPLAETSRAMPVFRTASTSCRGMRPSSAGRPFLCSRLPHLSSPASLLRESQAGSLRGPPTAPKRPAFCGKAMVTLTPLSMAKRHFSKSLFCELCSLQRGHKEPQKQLMPAVAANPVPRQEAQRKRSHEPQVLRRRRSPNATPQASQRVPSEGIAGATSRPPNRPARACASPTAAEKALLARSVPA
mmetsp:Transcript_46733/g.105945  ORF Transcript_46733/g.105945 Transcript_46733/m.105945 type:complete len:207 (+) Transcript_46733:280-900(+)